MRYYWLILIEKLEVDDRKQLTKNCKGVIGRSGSVGSKIGSTNASNKDPTVELVGLWSGIISTNNRATSKSIAGKNNFKLIIRRESTDLLWLY